MSKGVLDLYCGAGGMSHGFQQDRFFNVKAGVDVWDDALKTYQHNHSANGVQADLSTADSGQIPVTPDEVQVITGGPPCKGFSLAGDRNTNDERNQLVARFIDFVELFNPEVAVMENVVGILSMDLPKYDRGDVVDYIYERYEELGYSIEHRVLQADNFGIPQTRSRVFFIAVRDDIGTPAFPAETTPNEVQAVKGVLDQDFDKYANHDKTNHSQDMVDKISELGYKESVYDNYSEAWKRLDPDEPAPTIKENHGAPFVHPFEDRVGTPRECAAIQSFPNDYTFKGSKSSTLKQIGNAVPPELAAHVAQAVKSKIY